MWNRLLRFIAIRSALIFSLLHLGLLITAVGIGLAIPDYYQETWFQVLLVGIGLLFLTYVAALWLLIAPLLRIALLARKAMRWRKWILKELPVLLASLPALVEAIRALFGKSKSDSSSSSSSNSESLKSDPIPFTESKISEIKVNDMGTKKSKFNKTS